MNARNRFYLTTAIDYPNSRPHIGTAFEKIGADVQARYRRMEGYDVFFLMGNDENTIKVARRAAELGLDTKRYCDEMAQQFQEVWRLSTSVTTTLSRPAIRATMRDARSLCNWFTTAVTFIPEAIAAGIAKDANPSKRRRKSKRLGAFVPFTVSLRSNGANHATISLCPAFNRHYWIITKRILNLFSRNQDVMRS
jgi:hypothetical protein